MEEEQIRTLMNGDRFASQAGIRLLEVTEGYARASMEVTPAHFNGVGSAQGGAIFTLADLAFAAAVNSHGIVTVAINVSISFLKAVSQGTLFAEACEISQGSKICSCTVHVTDSEGALVAVFQGMAYRKKQAIADLIKT